MWCFYFLSLALVIGVYNGMVNARPSYTDMYSRLIANSRSRRTPEILLKQDVLNNYLDRYFIQLVVPPERQLPKNNPIMLPCNLFIFNEF
ncbi:hypothetical protein GCK32_000322 [Trichostrongylus colubriformis]|uniref:Uncharacterized protein n=1 Tax=Trichostrongylus colubriformis TaxID=6319 RepID=A0AAN8IG55_TRICO